jgi:hypothetical protein
VFACALSTGGVIGAAEDIVAILLVAGTLGKVVQVEAVYQSIGGEQG